MVLIFVWFMWLRDVSICIMICFDGIFKLNISIGFFFDIMVFLIKFMVKVVLFIEGWVVIMIRFDGCNLLVFLLRLVNLVVIFVIFLLVFINILRWLMVLFKIDFILWGFLFLLVLCLVILNILFLVKLRMFVLLWFFGL